MRLLYLILPCTAVATVLPPWASNSVPKRDDSLEKQYSSFGKRDDAINCTTALYREKMLAGFNLHRANHSVEALVWNQTLADAARNTTENGVVGIHDNAGTGWGQNLFWWYSSDPSSITPGMAIDSWYNGEFPNYDTYGNASILDLEDGGNWYPPPATPDAIYFHFTQSIWKASLTLGCHTADRPSDSSDGFYTACNFFPPGNSIADDLSWYENVLPPLGHDPVGVLC